MLTLHFGENREGLQNGDELEQRISCFGTSERDARVTRLDHSPDKELEDE
jgi:hypothetical protein